MMNGMGLNLASLAASAMVPDSAAGLLLRSSALVAMTAVVAPMLGRRSAALRHLLWSLALAGALLVPLLSTTLPWSWRILPVGVTTRTAVAPPSAPLVPAGMVVAPPAATEQAGAPARLTANPFPADGPSKPTERARGITFSGIALSVWAGVAVLLLVHFLLGRLTLAGLARRGRRMTEARARAEIDRMARRAGVRRPVHVVLSVRARVPMTWGAYRPVILLPDEAARWDEDRLRVVLLHEMAHVRRLDDLTQGLARVACALHWFNPLMWWAAARMRAESEHAADDLVLKDGALASRYARHLLEIVSQLGPGATPQAAVALAQRSRFEGRLLAILDGSRARSGVRTNVAMALTLLGACLVALLGVVAPARAADGSREQAMSRGPEVERSVPPKSHMETATRIRGHEVSSDDEIEATPPDSTSVRALMHALLQDQDGGVRNAAAWALGQLQDRTATAALSEALVKDTSVEVRRTAAWAMGQVQDPAGVPALGKSLSDPDGQVRSMSIWALGQIQSREAVAPLTHALQDKDPEARKMAAWALGQIQSADAVTPLASALGDSDEGVREQAAWALGQIQSESSVPGLTKALGDASPKVRTQAAWALGQVESSSAVGPLSAAVADSDMNVAAMAAWALGQIQPSRAPGPLLEAARSGKGEVQANAIWALAQIGDTAAVPALATASRHGDSRIRQEALQGLAGMHNAEALKAITALLQDSDPKVREAAVRAMAGGGRWGRSEPRPRPRPEPRPRPRPNGGG